MDVQTVLIFYFIGINILSFIVMLIDKNKAEKNKYRVSESVLITFALLGGSIGSPLGMYILNHKIRKFKFRFGIPMIILIQVIFLYTLNYIWL